MTEQNGRVGYLRGLAEGFQRQLDEIKADTKEIKKEIDSLKMFKWQVTGMSAGTVAVIEIIARNWPR